MYENKFSENYGTTSNAFGNGVPPEVTGPVDCNDERADGPNLDKIKKTPPSVWNSISLSIHILFLK